MEITEVHATWQPYRGPADVKRSDLPDDVFAFPKERAEPLTDAIHVRSAIARFNSVRSVTDAERDLAFQNILKAADYYSVSVSEKSWHEIGHRV